MKQKALINVSLDDKSRTKAMMIVSSDPGMEAFSWKGAEKNQLEVVGEVDIIKLVRSIRKKFGYAEVVSVAPVMEDPKPKDEAPEKDNEKGNGKEKNTGSHGQLIYYPTQWQNGFWNPPPGGVLVDHRGYPYPAHNPDDNCSIM